MELVTIPSAASILLCFLFVGTLPLSPHSGHPAPYRKEVHAELTGTTALDVYPEQDAIHLLLEEEIPGKPPRLVYRVSRDEGRSFSSPLVIPTHLPVLPGHRGNDPQIAAHGEQLVVVWTSRGSGYGERGKIGLVRSADGGKHWEPGKNAADDGEADGAHAFESLLFDESGRCHLVWLDERNGTMGLRAAYSDDGGKSWSTNRTIDPEVCTCCPTALLAFRSELFALYRMASPRDTALAVSRDHGETWEKLGPVGDFHWEFLGCPHWGSGIAAWESDGKENLYAAVQTGKQGRAGLYFLRSDDQGRRWTTPQALAGPQGRFVDLALSGKALCAAWEDSSGFTSQIVAALSSDGGMTWSPARKLSQHGVWATHPRVVGLENRFLVLWTETPDPLHSRWKTTRLELR